MKVKVSTATTDSVIRQLKNIDSIMFKVSEHLRGIIIKNWDKARGADDKPFPTLNAKYEEKKIKSGRKGIRNLLYTGKMIQGFKVFKKTSNKWILAFASPERDKARSNQKKATGMLDVSSKNETIIKKLAEKLFWSKVK